jgi:hypothetical protein
MNSKASTDYIPTIEELMQDSEPEHRSNSNDESLTARLLQIDDDEPTADLLSPELMFPPGSDDEDDKNS